MVKKNQKNAVMGGINWEEVEEATLPDIDGWYNPVAGEEPIAGKIEGAIGFTDRRGQLRRAVLVRVFEAVEAKAKGGADVSLKQGDILAVGVRAKLEPLLDYVANKGYCYFQALGKKPVDGGEMWLFRLKCKGTKGPRPVFDDSADIKPPPPVSVDDSQIPF